MKSPEQFHEGPETDCIGHHAKNDGSDGGREATPMLSQAQF